MTQPKKSRNFNAKRTNRSLNAFAIASSENKQKATPSAHRVGGSSDGEVMDEDSVDSGSDSDGNKWTLGHVGSDDSDIDSDDAMGDSDEERFEDFTFRGTTSNGPNKKKLRRGIDLSEGEGDNDEDDEEEDTEGYIDLSEMLDRKTPEDSDIEDDDSAPKRSKKRAVPESDDEDGMLLLRDGAAAYESNEEDSDDESEGFTGFSEDEDETPEDPLKLEALQSMISALPTAERSAKRIRLDDMNEGKNPGEYNLTISSNSKKLSLEDLIPTVVDPSLKKSLKLLANDSKGRSDHGVPGKLSAPLAKRQQDRIDRTAAYGQTKETLKKWVDTVKHNREADHLHFPLANAPNAPVTHSSKLVPLNPSESKPLNEFEATISGILKQSSMISEKQIQEFEELKTNKLSVEEVQKRRAELRLARDLMYREEIKAKRLKKIKSKSYHRIKKRERQREEQAIEGAIAEERGGSDTEAEERARRRAEERMNLKHKQSRWAKGIKQSGRTTWDVEARDGAVEMAQRHEELRQRIKGAPIGSGSDSEYEDDESDEYYEEGEDRKQRDLKGITKLDDGEQYATQDSKLMGMKFMQKAEAAKRKENDAIIQDLREGEETETSRDEDDDDSTGNGIKNTGRLSFNPQRTKTATMKAETRAEFEAPLASSDEESEYENDENVQLTNKASSISRPQKNPFTAPKSSVSQLGAKHQIFDSNNDTPINPWLPDPNGNITLSKGKALIHGKQEAKGAKVNHKISKARKAAAAQGIDENTNVVINPNATIKLAMHQDSDDEGEHDMEGQINLISAQGKKSKEQRKLIKEAFAGDNVIQEFKKEKQKTEEDEDDKIIDKTLPGWGHWSGAGLTKAQIKGNQRRKKVVKVVEGIQKDKRKDAKLEKVIINEKRDKKAVKFQTGQVPHPFESRAQYERSMRLPIGPEWTTKSTFQDATTPRVMVKQGRVVEPMAVPFK